MNKIHKLLILGVFLTGVFAGCATQPVSRCVSPGDTPEQHYIAGMETLEQNRFDAAAERFERAVYCDDDFSPAYGGLAIVYAQKASSQKDPDYSSVERKRSLEYAAKAKKTAGTQEEKFAYYVSLLRINTYLGGKDWLSKAQDAYKRAKSVSVDNGKLLYYQGAESADYFMGIAYLRGQEFQKARDLFAAVLNARKDGKWHSYADRAWKKTDRVARAVAGITIGDLGKRIAVQDAVTRGDLAALLMDELKIEKYFVGRGSATGQSEKAKEGFIPPDIAAFSFKDEAMTVMKWKIRGLEPKYDEASKTYLFKPMDTVKRGEMALVLEDILIRLTGNEKIATAYLGHEKSPFPDVKPTSPLYNAVMNVTTRGIMEGETSGEFMADKPVSGEDALLAVRVLKQKVNIN